MIPESREITGRWPLSSIAFFLIAVALLSIPTTYVVVRAGDVEAYDVLADKAIMWCPAVAALATVALHRIDLDRLGLRLPSWKFALAGYAIPLLVFSAAYAFMGISGMVAMSPTRFVAHAETNLHLGTASGVVGFGLVATIAVILDCAATMGEEIGWRGFLVPALAQRLSFFWTALLSGLIWAVWHYPMIFELGFGSVGSVTASTLLFTIDTVLLAFIMAWLRLRSGSIWPTVLYHASNNVFSNRVFEKLPIVSGVTTERVSKIVAEACVLAVILIVSVRSRRPERSATHTGALSTPAP